MADCDFHRGTPAVSTATIDGHTTALCPHCVAFASFLDKLWTPAKP
jgi:hypothetical protein